MLLGHSLLSLFPIGRLLLFAGETTLETSKLLFSFSVVSGVGDGISLGVGEIGFQSNVNAKFPVCWNMLDFALGIDTELAIVAICASDNANPLNLFDRECLDTLIGIANELKTTNPAAIGEDDMASIIIELPARGFVLDAPVVMLEFGVSLLSWFLLFAIVVEARDRKPCTVGRGLTSHGIEATSMGVFLGQYFTVGLQVVFRGSWIVHPQTQAFIANELGSPNSLLDGGILLFAATQFVLVDQHAGLLAFLLLLDMLFYRCQDLPIQGSIILFGYLSYLL
jgi:hypothetical protein